MRSATVVLLLISQTISFAAGPIRVAFWNAEFLGDPYSRGWPGQDPARGYGVARDPARLSALFSSFDADVIALCEVNDDDSDFRTRTNSVLDVTFAALNQNASDDWEYRLFAKRKRHKTSQLTGLAWNRKKVSPTTRRFRIPVSDISRDWNDWDRHPHAMQFSRGDSRTDFVVVPFHLKAGRNSSDEDQREAEAKALIAEFTEIEEHFGGEQDLILIGDFNTQHKNEPACLAFRDGGMFDLNYRDKETHPTGPLDRCFIPKSQLSAGHEFNGVRQATVLEPQDRGDYRKNISDHWPIVIEFLDLADDD